MFVVGESADVAAATLGAILILMSLASHPDRRAANVIASEDLSALWIKIHYCRSTLPLRLLRRNRPRTEIDYDLEYVPAPARCLSRRLPPPTRRLCDSRVARGCEWRPDRPQIV
jgi:hypothetical protein